MITVSRTMILTTLMQAAPATLVPLADCFTEPSLRSYQVRVAEIYMYNYLCCNKSCFDCIHSILQQSQERQITRMCVYV